MLSLKKDICRGRTLRRQFLIWRLPCPLYEQLPIFQPLNLPQLLVWWIVLPSLRIKLLNLCYPFQGFLFFIPFTFLSVKKPTPFSFRRRLNCRKVLEGQAWPFAFRLSLWLAETLFQHSLVWSDGSTRRSTGWIVLLSQGRCLCHVLPTK